MFEKMSKVNDKPLEGCIQNDQEERYRRLRDIDCMAGKGHEEAYVKLQDARFVMLLGSFAPAGQVFQRHRRKQTIRSGCRQGHSGATAISHLPDVEFIARNLRTAAQRHAVALSDQVFQMISTASISNTNQLLGMKLRSWRFGLGLGFG